MNEISKTEKTVNMEEFINLRAQEVSFDKIVEKLGGSKTTWLKRAGKFQEEILNRKISFKQMLRDEYDITLKNQLENIKLELTSIEDVLEGADWSKVKIEKLVDMKFKLLDRQDKLLSSDELIRSDDEIRMDREAKGPSYFDRMNHAMKFRVGNTESVPIDTEWVENE